MEETEKKNSCRYEEQFPSGSQCRCKPDLTWCIYP